MDQFLTMTAEFSRYMQEGVLVVKLFFDEYLYYNMGEHLPQLLDLLQWMTSISITGNYRLEILKLIQIYKIYKILYFYIFRATRKRFDTRTKYILRIEFRYEM